MIIPHDRGFLFCVSGAADKRYLLATTIGGAVKIHFDDEIKQAIITCVPLKIAVAYIGADWKTYIPNSSCLEAIIVSPTVGSNPRAIADLVKQVGWDKVFFLLELHAKTYIGKSVAIIGSANLTNNGLSGEGLVELCVEVNAEESLKKLNGVFDCLMERAKDQYPTMQSKKTRLEELEKSWGSAISGGIIRGKKSNDQSFENFELLGNSHFYIRCYQPGNFEYADDVKAIQDLMKEDAHFDRNDKVEKNKWVLLWQMTNSSKPDGRVKPRWLYIHEVFENGIIDEGYEYPKCAMQRNDMETPDPPFEITGDIISAFKKVVQEESVAKYLIPDKEVVFTLAHSQKGIPLLIRGMKKSLESLESLESLGS